MKKKLNVLFVVFIFPALLGAQALTSNHDIDKTWNQENFKVLKEEKQKQTTVLILQNNTNEQIQASFTTMPPKNNIDLLFSLYKQFLSIQSLKIQNIHFNFLENKLDIILNPSSFKNQDSNLLSFFPAGLYFFYNLNQKKLFYHLKFLKENQLYTIEGEFTTEKLFLEQIMVYFKEKNPDEFFVKQKDLQQQQFQEEQIRKETEEKVRKELKEELKEELKQEIKQEVEKEFQEQEEPHQCYHQKKGFSHALRLFIGTGTSIAGGYAFGWHGFNIFPYAGIIGFDTYDGDEKISNFAVAAGLRLHYSFFVSKFFEPYTFVGSAYNIKTENYENNRYVVYLGFGEIVFNYFFLELSFMIGNNSKGLSVGAGIHFPL